ncbi:MAG: hypothetical protein RL407_835 [Bacteroidota bacterium]|jgi:hypothetical protein
MLVAGGLFMGYGEIAPEQELKRQTAPDSEAVLKEWKASPDGI